MVRETAAADPLGRAMRDYQRGEYGKLRYQDGARTQDGRVSEYYFQPSSEWEDQDVAFLDRVLEYGDPILDAGCGAGQHALWFQERGVDVIGIDVSPNAVRAARERGVEDARVMDMFDLEFDRDRFRTVLAVGTQVGLAGSFAGVRDLLGEFARVADEEGVAVVHNYDPAELDDDFFGYRPDPREGVAHRCFHFEYEPGTDGAESETVVGRTLHFLLFGPHRLADVAVGTPWTVSAVEAMGNSYSAVLEKLASAQD